MGWSRVGEGQPDPGGVAQPWKGPGTALGEDGKLLRGGGSPVQAFKGPPGCWGEGGTVDARRPGGGRPLPQSRRARMVAGPGCSVGGERGRLGVYFEGGVKALAEDQGYCPTQWAHGSLLRAAVVEKHRPDGSKQQKLALSQDGT